MSSIFDSGIIQYNYPTILKFGPGASKLAHEILKENGLKRPLVVTDRDLAKLPIVPAYAKYLESKDLHPTVFSGIWGNPVKGQVEAGVDAYKSGKCDAIIALGGGAAMDVAKAIQVMANHKGDLFDYEDRPGAKPIDGPLPYLITIPTTAGTGSEVGRSTVVSDEKTHIKKIIFSPRLMPARALIDPELLLDLPAKVTATTGMDALTHLVEAFLSKGFHPMADGIALEGIRLVDESLEKCVKFAAKGGDRSKEHIEARGKMMAAAFMGAVAFQKGLGFTHSCAHALSTVVDMHHGLANGILINYAMEFNLKAVPERFARLANAINPKSTRGEDFVQWLVQLKSKIGIPETLGEVGVKASHLDALLDVAVQDGCHACNPVPVTRADFRAVLTKAIGAA